MPWQDETADRGYDPDGSSKLPVLAADELPIIEAAYRLIADPAAFDQFFNAWSARIERQHAADRTDYESPQLARSIALVADLFRAMPADIVEDGIERFVRNQASPAMVLTLGNHVVATNAAAAERFGAIVGRQSALDWLDYGPAGELDRLRRSARINGNLQHVILRIQAESSLDRELAEARIIQPSADTGPLILVRLLSNPWTSRVADMLRECFELTDAEVDVARALYRTPDPAAVAAARATSLRTVRNQLQQIYAKTWVAGQAELVRLIALLCANAADEASPQAGWTDPLGRERVFQCANGRNLAYSWMGREGGYPAILVHGPLTGYVLASEIQDALTAANIQLFTICRPGFGNSDKGAGCAVTDGADAILALARHLDLSDCAGVGLVNGIVPLVEAAAREPGRFNQLLAIGSTYPFVKTQIATFPPVQRTIFALSQQRSRSLNIIVAAGLRFARRFGWEFVLSRMTAGVPADRQVMFDPVNLPRVMASTSMVIAQDGSAFANDLSLMFHDFKPALSERWPLHILAGAEDPIYPLSGVEALADGRTCTFEVVPGAAQRVYDAAPQQVARAICEAVERSRSRKTTS